MPFGGDTSQILQLDTEEGREGRNARMEGEEGNEEDKIAFHFYPIIYRARKEEKRKSERRDSFFLSEINFDREREEVAKKIGALVVRSVAIVNVGAGRDRARERESSLLSLLKRSVDVDDDDSGLRRRSFLSLLLEARRHTSLICQGRASAFECCERI